MALNQKSRIYVYNDRHDVAALFNNPVNYAAIKIRHCLVFLFLTLKVNYASCATSSVNKNRIKKLEKPLIVNGPFDALVTIAETLAT